MTGRPIRFLAVVLGGWTGLRVWLLWPTLESMPDVIRAIAPPAAALVRAAPRTTQPVPSPVLASQSLPPPARASLTPPPSGQRASDPRRIALALAGLARVGDPVELASPSDDPAAPAAQGPALDPPSGPSRAARLSATAWLIARSGGASVPLAPQLGGSQAGVRVLYALGEARRVSLAGRLATPLGRGRAEAAVGLDWRPFAAPVHLFAEQRVPLGRGRGGPAAGVIAGLAPTPVVLGLRLEGYGQAGVIARRGGEGFADGALRLGAPVARLGGATLDLGLGAWGAAQRGARRLDLGPAATLALPLGERPMRLSLECGIM